ncbi:hypothetical protein ACPA9J_27130 [Pseudomonas aeruginosa]
MASDPARYVALAGRQAFVDQPAAQPPDPPRFAGEPGVAVTLEENPRVVSAFAVVSP